MSLVSHVYRAYKYITQKAKTSKINNSFFFYGIKKTIVIFHVFYNTYLLWVNTVESFDTCGQGLEPWHIVSMIFPRG